MQNHPGERLLAHGRELARRQAARIGREAAEDLGAETVLRALRTPPPDSNVEPWMERIFHNLVVDSWRRRKPAVSVDDVTLACPEPSPEDCLLNEERKQILRGTLAQLPDNLRRAVELRFFAGHDERSASLVMGVAVATVRTRIHRGLLRLRAMLSGMRSFLPVLGGLSPRAAGMALAPSLVAAFVLLPELAPPPSEPSLRPQPALAQGHVRRASSPHAVVVAVEDQPLPATTAKAPHHRVLAAKPAEPVPAVPPPKVYDFEQDNVEGEIQRPDGIIVEGQPQRLTWDSLIEIPANFVPSFQKMIEDRW